MKLPSKEMMMVVLELAPLVLTSVANLCTNIATFKNDKEQFKLNDRKDYYERNNMAMRLPK